MEKPKVGDVLERTMTGTVVEVTEYDEVMVAWDYEGDPEEAIERYVYTADEFEAGVATGSWPDDMVIFSEPHMPWSKDLFERVLNLDKVLAQDTKLSKIARGVKSSVEQYHATKKNREADPDRVPADGEPHTYELRGARLEAMREPYMPDEILVSVGPGMQVVVSMTAFDMLFHRTDREDQ